MEESLYERIDALCEALCNLYAEFLDDDTITEVEDLWNDLFDSDGTILDDDLALHAIEVFEDAQGAMDGHELWQEGGQGHRVLHQLQNGER